MNVDSVQDGGSILGTQHVIRAIVALALVAATPAHAEWLKASSRHFVVYSNTSEAALRKQATALENFDAVLRHFQGRTENPDAEFNRVTVYVLPDADAVEKLSQMKNVAGFYVPRVTGSVAFTPRTGSEAVGEMSPRITLFHEYAHHFLLANYVQAYPAWFGEGYAEFASTMYEKDGRFWIGGPANHRAYGLVAGPGMPLRQLLDPPAKMSPEKTEALYGRGWLLTHYMMFDAERRKQLGRYLALFNAGKPSVEAATEAFGDLKALDRKLDAYLNARTMLATGMSTSAFPVPKIDIRPLTGGERALIVMRMTSTRGVDARTAPPLYAKAKVAAVPFPTDAVAQGWLAEMAFDAGQVDAAEAAADAAIAADPKSSQGLLYKARVRMMRALAAKSTDPAVWAEVRSWIVKANRAMPDDAAALSLFYDSFMAQGIRPGKNAVLGLYRASMLVPQDPGLRFQAARQMILDGDVARAKETLRPLASDPHGGGDNAAARLLALIEAGQTGQAALDALAKVGEEKKTD